MKTKYTAGEFRRNYRRIRRNARTVVDNFGFNYRITKSGRVLETLDSMTGIWRSPSATDGLQKRGVNRYYYLTGFFTDALGV